jgi:hypothetical protein
MRRNRRRELFVGLAVVLAGSSCSSSLGGGPDGGKGGDGASEVEAGDGASRPIEDSLCWVTEELASTTDVCVFPLPPAPNPNTSPDHIYVWADNLRIIQDQTEVDGWDYTDATHQTIEIFGPNCDRIYAGVVKTVTVTFYCYGPA